MVLENVKQQIEQCLITLYNKDISLKKYLIQDKEIQRKIFILESLYQVYDWLVYSDFPIYTELVNSICSCSIQESIATKIELAVSLHQFFEEEWAGGDFCCEKYEEEWEGTQPICELT